MVYKIVKVVGDSMSPTLNDGDYVLTKKPRRLTPGLIYVVNHSDLGRIIKRLKSIDGDRCSFQGDNTASTATSLMGLVEPNRIAGHVIARVTTFGFKRL